MFSSRIKKWPVFLLQTAKNHVWSLIVIPTNCGQIKFSLFSFLEGGGERAHLVAHMYITSIPEKKQSTHHSHIRKWNALDISNTPSYFQFLLSDWFSAKRCLLFFSFFLCRWLTFPWCWQKPSGERITANRCRISSATYHYSILLHNLRMKRHKFSNFRRQTNPFWKVF